MHTTFPNSLLREFAIRESVRRYFKNIFVNKAQDYLDISKN